MYLKLSSSICILDHGGLLPCGYAGRRNRCGAVHGVKAFRHRPNKDSPRWVQVQIWLLCYSGHAADDYWEVDNGKGGEKFVNKTSHSLGVIASKRK